jgi:hypothetical protein
LSLIVTGSPQNEDAGFPARGPLQATAREGSGSRTCEARDFEMVVRQKILWLFLAEGLPSL